MEAQTGKILLFVSHPETCISQKEPGLGATDLPRNHCSGSCHAGHGNSRSHCRMGVPRRREVTAARQGTAGPSWPGWWQCLGVLDEAEPTGNCREKENKPITEAHGRGLRLLHWHPLTHSLNSASQNSSVGQGLSLERSRRQEQARRGVPFAGQKRIYGQQAHKNSQAV